MDAIAAIYDALDDSEGFVALPAQLALAAGARSTMLQVFTPDLTMREAACSYFPEAMVENYVAQEFYRLYPWRPPVSRPENFNRLIAMDDAVPVERLVDSYFYAENFRRWGDDTGRCLGAMFALDDGFLTLGMHRPARGAAFSPEEVSALEPLMPHLRRMLQLRGQLGAAQAKAVLAEAALDAQADAVFVVDALGAPHLMNAAAQALLARHDTLVLSRVGLRALNDGEAGRLAEAIARACARTGAQGGALSLRRPSGPPLRVLVSPLRAGHLTRALVVVNDPSRIDPGLIAALRGLYGLSNAEAEIAVMLSRGVTPTKVARQRGVTTPTIRTQIRGALGKTDARGLSELVALVASMPPRA